MDVQQYQHFGEPKSSSNLCYKVTCGIIWLFMLGMTIYYLINGIQERHLAPQTKLDPLALRNETAPITVINGCLTPMETICQETLFANSSVSIMFVRFYYN